MLDLLRFDREVPALFWDGNLVREEDGIYVFETKYVSDSDEVLPLDYLKNIPEKIRKEFLRKVPLGIHELANKLIGSERNSFKVLQRFYQFVYAHEKLEIPTTGKPIEQLLEEYNDGGFFYGGCKEARDFLIALCNAKGYPAKKVYGKSLGPCTHVWADVFVPVEDGYKFFPIDAALGYFGNHSPMDHLFFEKSPGMPINLSSMVVDIVRSKKTVKNYKLSIEKIR